jgi:hypothetical protein
MSFDRLLTWAGDDDPARRLSKIAAFQIILILHHWASIWNHAIAARGQWDAQMVFQLVGVNLAAAIGLFPKWRRVSLAALAALALQQIFDTFPLSSNHLMLEFLFAAFAAMFDVKNEEEQRTFLQSARLLFVVVLFHTGLQKLIHGYYFRGEFFSYLVSGGERFHLVLQWAVPADELARLRGYTTQVGEGPYRAAAPLLIAISNATYLLEMGCAVGLLIPQLRVAAFAMTLVVLFAIESGAREVYFGLLFLNALLLFPRKDVNRLFIPVFAVFYIVAVLARIGIVPGSEFN